MSLWKAWSEKFVRSAPRILVVQPRKHPPAFLSSSLKEALRLAEALGNPRFDHSKNATSESPLSCYSSLKSHNPWIVVQQRKRVWSDFRKRINAGTYFGKGTIDNVKAHIFAVDSLGKKLDAVFVNTTLSGVQNRNLQEAWQRPVLDRVGMIIEIFGSHAQSSAAKLQVELAALEYKKSRLVRSGADSSFGTDGAQQVVSAKGKAGGGGRGFLSGAGEAEINLQRTRIASQQMKLKRQLADVERTRGLHRAARRRHMTAGTYLPTVAVVGYTNAGKSTLVSALSQQEGLAADDRLFATLDPRARSVILPSGRKVLLSDTVGFISDLPTQLLEAFKATLEEVVEADLLLHVVDSSSSSASLQYKTVVRTLEDLGIPRHSLPNLLIEAWNKIDLVEARQGSSDEGIGADAMESDLSERGIEDEFEELMLEDASSEVMDGPVELKVEDMESTFVARKVLPSLDWRESNRSDQLGGSLNFSGVPRVFTSAVDGRGLHELLLAIDSKLKAIGL